jgi:hypothetical protein
MTEGGDRGAASSLCSRRPWEAPNFVDYGFQWTTSEITETGKAVKKLKSGDEI